MGYNYSRLEGGHRAAHTGKLPPDSTDDLGKESKEMMNTWTARWVSRVVFVGTTLIAFYLIGSRFAWYFSDLSQAIGFIGFGFGVLLATLFWWRNARGRTVAIIGIVLWVVPGWLVSYAWTIVFVPKAPNVPMVMQQITWLLGGSLPYILLGLAVLSVSLSGDIWKATPRRRNDPPTTTDVDLRTSTEQEAKGE
jgi:Na+/proline symporter